jgi:membrane protein
MKQKLNEFIKKLKQVSAKPIMKILPGQLAFYSVLSLIPLIYLVGVIGSLFSISANSFIDMIKSSFPPSTSNLIIPLISGKGFDFNMLIFMFSAFFLASNGTHSIIITSNILYDIPNNNYIRRRIKAIILTITLVILLGFIIIVPAFGTLILNTVKDVPFVKPVFDQIISLYNIFKIPLSFIFIYFNIKLIYTIAPDKQVKSKDSTKGALFTTTFWIIITEVYSYYVSHFVHYDIFYGSIANLIILLLWIYFLSYVFVIGLAFNASSNKTVDITELKIKKSK